MAYPYDFFPGGISFLNGQSPTSGGLLMSGGVGSLFPSPPAAPQSPTQTQSQQFMSGASPGFIGLQGLQPGFDPSSLDFKQLQQLLGLTSGAPERIDEFRAQSQGQINRLGQAGHRAIEREAATSFANQAGQFGAQHVLGSRQQADAMAAMGLAPSIFQTSIQPQQDMQLAQQIGQARGESRAGAAQQHQGLREDQFDRRTGLNQAVLNARNQLEQYYDSLLLQKYLAEIAAEAQMNAAGKKAKSDTTGQLLALAGTVASFFSDARLKDDVQTLVEGSPRIVSWRWNRTAERLGLRGRGVGVIAQELEQVAPERVVMHPSGFKMVRYG